MPFTLFPDTDNQLIWICPQCNEENGTYNGYCEYCYQYKNIKVFNPDKYFIRDIRIYHICERLATAVTPQEELYAEFFTKHINILHPFIKDMNLLEIRAYRERMSKIALEGKAAIYAADKAEKEILKQKKIDSKPTGFERSVETDDVTSDAINTVKERQKKLTKTEKIHAGLVALGMSDADATKTMAAGNILAQLKDKKSQNIIKDNETRSPLSQENGFVIKKSPEELSEPESKPIFNPFEKK